MKRIETACVALMLLASMEVKSQDYKIPVLENDEPMATGQFTPDWESLRTYEVPEWFRDAKFGIWAHWGPQCVEGSGDWMAREMYMEGTAKYNYHRKHYGHPSEVGFKDILPLFKAENWHPEELVRFYKEECGAQYFFALGNHHDNFDLWEETKRLLQSGGVHVPRLALGVDEDRLTALIDDGVHGGIEGHVRAENLLPLQ